MRALGAAYLLYVAWKLYCSGRQYLTSESIGMPQSDGVSGSTSIKDGLFVSFSNPKAILFLMSVFPQHIDPNGNRIQQFVILFAILACVVFSIHFIYALFGSTMRKSQHFNMVLAATNLTAATFLVVFSTIIWISLLVN